MKAFIEIHGRWLLFLAGCLTSGCVSGPLPEKAAWPWENSKEYGQYQTGDYFTFRGNVAQFGEPPKATKPVSVSPPIPDSSAFHQASSAKTGASLSPTEKKEAIDRIGTETKTDYDFTVQNLKLQPALYLPVEATRSAYDVTAFNHGNAPVSVILHLDQLSSENILIDKELPVSAVVPPHKDRGLVQLRPRMKNEAFNFRYSYSWSLGDYTARHHCPERYRFPFGKNVRVFASVTGPAESTPFTRNAVIFSMPADTPVFAARKGTVVRRAKDKLDILHEDSTIATYSHVGKIADDMVAGKVVSTEDVIGTAGAVDDKEAYIQLTVWRPEAPPAGSATGALPGTGFELVSFPLEFCSRGSNECRTLAQSGWISQDKVAEAKKQRKTKPKPGK